MELERSSKSKASLIFVILFLLAVLGLIYLFIKGKNKLVSPVPKEPSFQVIYYTPTPGATTPTSTPSATPKPKKTPTLTKTEATPSATSNPSPKPTQ